MNTHYIFIIDNWMMGGAEIVMADYITDCKKRGMNCSLVVRNKRKIVDLHYKKYFEKLELNTLSLSAAVKLILKCRRNQRFVFLTTNWKLYVLVCLFGMLSGGMSVLREANSTRVLNAKGLAYKLIRKYLSKVAFRWCNLIIAPSNGVKTDLDAYYGSCLSKTLVITNRSEAYQRDMEDHYKSDVHEIEDDTYILAVGRFVAQKQYRKILGLYSEYCARCKTLRLQPQRLYCVGHSTNSRAFYELVDSFGLAEMVKGLGVVPAPRIVMRRASVLLCWPLFEGFPNVIHESLSLGVPVVGPYFEHGLTDLMKISTGYHLVDNIEEGGEAVFELAQRLKPEAKVNKYDNSMFGELISEIEKI